MVPLKIGDKLGQIGGFVYFGHLFSLWKLGKNWGQFGVFFILEHGVSNSFDRALFLFFNSQGHIDYVRAHGLCQGT